MAGLRVTACAFQCLNRGPLIRLAARESGRLQRLLTHERLRRGRQGADEGDKHVLDLREGSTGSTRVVRSLLRDLIERGLDADRHRGSDFDRPQPTTCPNR